MTLYLFASSPIIFSSLSVKQIHEGLFGFEYKMEVISPFLRYDSSLFFNLAPR